MQQTALTRSQHRVRIRAANRPARVSCRFALRFRGHESPLPRAKTTPRSIAIPRQTQRSPFSRAPCVLPSHIRHLPIHHEGRLPDSLLNSEQHIPLGARGSITFTHSLSRCSPASLCGSLRPPQQVYRAQDRLSSVILSSRATFLSSLPRSDGLQVRGTASGTACPGRSETDDQRQQVDFGV